MSVWMIWMALAGALVVFELFTGTFYVLMIAIGIAAGGVMALAGFPLAVQFLVAAVVGLGATGILHRSRFGRPLKSDAARDPNVNLDIGQTIAIDTWSEGHARVPYRGALWDVDLAPGALPEAGIFRIVAVHGSRLVVTNQ